MSNQIVGSVYQTIMDTVLAASKNDFEEHGVDQSTLNELKQMWQERLSALKVASFPWDPPTEPVRNPPTVPSNVPKPDPSPAPASLPQQHQEPVNFPNVPIKQEGGGYQQPVSQAAPPYMNSLASGIDGNAAQMRAQNLIQQRYGANVPLNFQNQQGGNPQLAAQQQRMMQQMPGQAQQGQRPQHMPPQRQPNVYASQTDGADDAVDDWNAVVSRKNAEGDSGRFEADLSMRQRLDMMSARLDSGLMVPLDTLPKHKQNEIRAIIREQKRALKQEPSSSEAGPSTLPQVVIPQYDGELGRDDEEEDVKDEDAINSELDDSEDDLDNNDDENDENIDFMLCLYDKVQRVKNKWKCTLKDGILTTNKKEYLFHKANGEFEW